MKHISMREMRIRKILISILYDKSKSKKAVIAEFNKRKNK